MTDLICIDARPAVAFRSRPNLAGLRYLARYALERTRPTQTCKYCCRPECTSVEVRGVVGEWCERRFASAPPDDAIIAHEDTKEEKV